MAVESTYDRDRIYITYNGGPENIVEESKGFDYGTEFILAIYSEFVFAQIYGYLGTMKTISKIDYAGGGSGWDVDTLEYEGKGEIVGAVNYYSGGTKDESILTQSKNITFSVALKKLVDEYGERFNSDATKDSDNIVFKGEIRELIDLGEFI